MNAGIGMKRGMLPAVYQLHIYTLCIEKGFLGMQADAQDVVELMQACVWDDYLANSSVSNFQRGGAKGKKVRVPVSFDDTASSQHVVMALCCLRQTMSSTL